METMQDKFMTTVRIGPKGQIVIPKEVRAVFDQGAQAAAPDVPEAETKVFASALERELKKGDGK